MGVIVKMDKEQKEYEERLRRRLKILGDQIESGKVKINKGLSVISSLEAVRKGPDGEVDLDTVDGLVRSLALGVTAMHDRDELKATASLSEIQNMYFEFIDKNFGQFYNSMKENGLTPDQAASALTRSEDAIKEFTNGLDGFLNVVEEFWKNIGDVAYIHIEDLRENIKGVFGGDLFPTASENLASKCGIYTDTLILPDPFLRTKHVFAVSPPERQAYYLIKHGLNILQYKELACAKVDIPIVVILPDKSALEEEERDFNQKLGIQDALLHNKRIFGREFESVEDLMGFAQSLDTIDKAISEIADESRVLFDVEWKGDVASQLNQALKSTDFKQFGVTSPGVLLAGSSIGRMSTSNELLIKSRRLGGIPIIDAPTSWKYLSWKLGYDAEKATSESNTEGLHITRGLNDLANTDMQWLGKVPVDSLIEIRQQGAMDEIRSILGKGIDELVTSNPEDFNLSQDVIFCNICEAFAEHQKNINELSAKKWKFAGKDIGSWLVAGTIEVTAAATGMPFYGLATIAADQLLDIPKLKDIPKSIRELADETNKIKKSPVAMLFNISKVKQK
jgi:hypothetical protein